MDRLQEAIAVAEEYIAHRQHHAAWQGKSGGIQIRSDGTVVGVGHRPSCQDLVRECGRDMRPIGNGIGRAIAVAILAAEWMALPEGSKVVPAIR